MPLVSISFRNQTTQTIDAPCYTHQWLSYVELCWAPSASTHSVGAPCPTGLRFVASHPKPPILNGISTSIHKLLTRIQCNHESNSQNLIPKYKWNIMEEYHIENQGYMDRCFGLWYEAPGMYKNTIGHLCGGLHLSLPEPKVLELREKTRCDFLHTMWCPPVMFVGL